MTDSDRLAQIQSKTAVVIPAYHEEKHIGEVVLRTRAQLQNVLVIDDGSTDKTAAHARAAGAEVIVHPQNLGKGEAIKTGLRYWLDRQFDFVIILDSDGQHRPEEIDRFLNVAADGDAALVMGNRMGDVARMPRLRRFVNRFMSKQISDVCGQEIPDTQCGFRMLHRQLIPAVLGGAARFDYETEMLFIASQNRFQIQSVPISTVYSDEVSSIHPVRDTIRFLRLMRRYRKLSGRS